MTDKEMWEDDLKFIEILRTENETLKSQNDNYKKIIGKALNKINNMFEVGDEFNIIDDLLELSKILKDFK
jgi:hypothetical protein